MIVQLPQLRKLQHTSRENQGPKLLSRRIHVVVLCPSGMIDEIRTIPAQSFAPVNDDGNLATEYDAFPNEDLDRAWASTRMSKILERLVQDGVPVVVGEV